MLYRLSLKNIRKSFKDYMIYFITLILGVAIFYMFNAIESQGVFFEVTESSKDIMDLLTGTMNGLSVFVVIILASLIIYANQFLMKRRNKEFAIYLTLGMSKKKISRILVLETVVIGVISLVVGIIVGTLLSQLMGVFIINMFEADMRKFRLTFSTKAMIQTTVYFAGMYVLIAIFNVFEIGKCKLIDLINKSRKNQKIRNRNLVVSIIVFIVSIAVIWKAYDFVLGDDLRIVQGIIFGCVGTFLFFWSVSGVILRILMSTKGTYYKSLNSFTIRQISSKINTEVMSITMVCLELFFTICILSTCLSMKNSFNNDLKELAAVDFQAYKEHGQENGQNEYSTHADLNNLGVDMNQFEEMISISIYNIYDLTLEKTVCEKDKNNLEGLQLWYKDGYEDVMKLSDYNKLAGMFGSEQYELNNDEYIVVTDFPSMEEYRKDALKGGIELNIGGNILKPKYNDVKKGYWQMTTAHVNPGIFVLPDYIVDTYKVRTHYTTVCANYKANTDKQREEIEKNLLAKLNDTENNLGCITKIELYDSGKAIGVLVTFIGLYLGITFLISCVAMLALKSLSESNDNKERYTMLRKIGTDEKMIDASLFKQIGVSFFLPLSLACVHAIAGNKFAGKMLLVWGVNTDKESVIVTALIIALIYGGYFLITYISGKNIVKEA